jgi:glutathione S-transferase
VTSGSRLRGQDGFIREILWVAVVIAIVAVVVLDGMAIFRAYQSVSDDSTTAAAEARTEYAQTLSAPAAKLAAQQYLTKSDLELVEFSAAKTTEGNVEFTVTAQASADTYAFRLLGAIPPLKDWVERTTHPTGTGASQ